MTIYDVIGVERKTAEFRGIKSTLQKIAQNREKTTNGDYLKKMAATLTEIQYKGAYRHTLCFTIWQKGLVISQNAIFRVLIETFLYIRHRARYRALCVGALKSQKIIFN